ncbi:MAG: 16S rRNA (guanine(966)-N(2))-methyltransferase RsmD [Ruminococcaceae bacterium]|nr:16S rRNA (guanine(966)-N(2))-methyltransferase RsmD [Oscillospiraceae bacterium]
MRIITGSAKGIKLCTLEGDATRPTSERAKEALFSMIQFDIEGRRILDLFAGSGQLGLEAVSRGAAFCMFTDASPDAISIVRKNIEKTHFVDKCKTAIADYRNFLRKSEGREGFDIVFLDPPYASDALTDALFRIYKTKLMRHGCLLVCESESGDMRIFEKEPMLAGMYRSVKKKNYGRVHIEILTPCEEYYNNDGTENE